MSRSVSVHPNTVSTDGSLIPAITNPDRKPAMNRFTYLFTCLRACIIALRWICWDSWRHAQEERAKERD